MTAVVLQYDRSFIRRNLNAKLLALLRVKAESETARRRK